MVTKKGTEIGYTYNTMPPGTALLSITVKSLFGIRKEDVIGQGTSGY